MRFSGVGSLCSIGYKSVTHPIWVMWWRGILLLRRHCYLSLISPLKTGVDDSRHTTHYFCLFRNMGFIEIFTLCITVLAVYATVICFRSLLPRYIIPNVSTLLNDVEQCLASAVESGAIPAVSEYRANIETYGTLHPRRSSSH